eukprot:GHVT01055987.1.p1 GENE.GHVT01055987.1~~GHVT01055987.1.p1  ORF type:complete len:524 (-),score=27.68 GHVT01055987.1:229-1623(-)
MGASVGWLRLLVWAACTVPRGTLLLATCAAGHMHSPTGWQGGRGNIPEAALASLNRKNLQTDESASDRLCGKGAPPDFFARDCSSAFCAGGAHAQTFGRRLGPVTPGLRYVYDRTSDPRDLRMLIKYWNDKYFTKKKYQLWTKSSSLDRQYVGIGLRPKGTDADKSKTSVLRYSTAVILLEKIKIDSLDVGATLRMLQVAAILDAQPDIIWNVNRHPDGDVMFYIKRGEVENPEEFYVDAGLQHDLINTEKLDRINAFRSLFGTNIDERLALVKGRSVLTKDENPPSNGLSVSYHPTSQCATIFDTKNEWIYKSLPKLGGNQTHRENTSEIKKEIDKLANTSEQMTNLLNDWSVVKHDGVMLAQVDKGWKVSSFDWKNGITEEVPSKFASDALLSDVDGFYRPSLEIPLIPTSCYDYLYYITPCPNFDNEEASHDYYVTRQGKIEKLDIEGDTEMQEHLLKVSI